MACIFLCWSAVRVHDSQTYRKMDVTRERIGRIVERRWGQLSVGWRWGGGEIYFDLCVYASGVARHQFGLLGTDLHAVGCGGVVETLN